LYERNNLLDIIEKTTRDVFVPITVGGGLRSVDDVAAALRAGADKVSINTAAIQNPSLISDIAINFGSQCVVLSIQAKRINDRWEAFYENGREQSGFDVVDWAKRGQDLGAGEILVSSVDQEGTAKGFDVQLMRKVSDAVTIPVIASGGMGQLTDIEEVVEDGHVDAVAMAHVLHYGHYTVPEVRQFCVDRNIPVRTGNIAKDSCP